LRILAQIAGRVEEENFMSDWSNAADDQEIKEVLLRDERLFSLILDKHSKSSEWIGLPLKEIKIPEGCLVALLRRNKDTIIPSGNTVFAEGDRLTIIGDPGGLNQLRKEFSENN
jgi:Trk K+ transport system NAD-binding subunit